MHPCGLKPGSLSKTGLATGLHQSRDSPAREQGKPDSCVDLMYLLGADLSGDAEGLEIQTRDLILAAGARLD
jgi:hypothetical protein